MGITAAIKNERWSACDATGDTMKYYCWYPK